MALPELPHMDAHEAVLKLYHEKRYEIDERLSANCPHTPKHTAVDVYRSLPVCSFAEDDKAIWCWDGMVYLMEDLHGLIWPEHSCLDRLLD